MSGAIPFSEASRTGYQRQVAVNTNPVLQGYVWPRYDTAPGQGELSLSYFDTAKAKPGWYNGSAWKYALEEDASGNVSITGTLSVTGASTLGAVNAGNTAITGTLSVSAAVTFSSTLAAGNTTVTGTLSVSGTASMATVNGTSVTATTGIGYRAGAGGTATQATSKSTGVTLNARCGRITMDAANLPADSAISFVLSNNTITATDILIVTHQSGGTGGAYMVNGSTASNSATITVRNVTSGDLAEAIVIGFAVIRAVTS